MKKKIQSAISKPEAEMSKPQSLRVLVVEDSEDDALLVIRELKKGGYNPVYERVETEKAMSKALREKPWDIILCDYTLPKFSVAKAIALLKETNIDIPFLLVTGSVGEELAVECMRLGAQDYIMKNNLSRLCPAIKRELEEEDSRSKQKQAKEALSESEEKNRNILENIQESYFENDLAGNFTFVNDSLCRNLGYTREELIGKNSRQYTDEKTAKKIYQTYNRIYRTGEPSKGIEEEYIRKDGIKMFAELSVSLIRDAEGKPIGFRGIARDVTERKQAEDALRKSEEMLRLITENMSDMIRVTDLQGINLYLSPSHSKSLGYSMEERVGKPSFDIVHPDDIERLIKLFSDALASIQEGLPSNQHITVEYRIRHADGHYIWLETVGDILRDAQGKPTTIVQSSRDISGRKQAEESLQESEEKYRLVVENAKEAIIITQDIKLVFVNRAAVDMTGYSKEILTSKPFTDFIHPDDRNMVIAHHIGRIKGEEVPPVYSFRIISQDGIVKWIELNAAIIQWKGRPATLNFLNDISERKLAEEERKQSFERMRKALGATVQAISMTVEMKDPYTSGHQQRVSDLARSIATEMGLSADQRDFIRTASTIHDIGKISIPSEILSKPTKLTDLEFNLIKTHSQSGYDILKDIEFPWPVANVILQHHERMDGSGYPHGIKGDDILLEARILTVADVVEAMASHRPYRPALGIDLALEEISRNKGILYDPDAVDACLKLFREKGYTLVIKKS